MTKKLKVKQELTTTPPHGNPHAMHAFFLLNTLLVYMECQADIQPTTFELL